jgi:integrase
VTRARVAPVYALVTCLVWARSFELEQATNVRRRRLAQAVQKANARLEGDGVEPISERLTPHGLRHTFASLLFAVGEDARYVMGQLGHADAAFTLSVYAKTMNRRDGEPQRLRALVQGGALDVPGPRG